MMAAGVRGTGDVEKHLVDDDVAYGGPLNEPPLHLATGTASKGSVRILIDCNNHTETTYQYPD